MASGKHAFGFCDRTGQRYPLSELVEEFSQGRPTGLRVGRDMVDEDHPQNWLGRLKIGADSQALRDARPDNAVEDSRRMFSWKPVGLGNLHLRGSVGRLTFS